MPRATVLALALAALFAAHPPARAGAEVEVDMQLVLAVDVSRSMSLHELEIQRRGYAAALTSPEVLRAIRSGFLGRVAVTYVEWAGAASQSVVVPWTLIEDARDAAEVAARILDNRTVPLRRTSISGALLFATELFEDNGFASWRRVIDVSGDGPNNDGIPVLVARDRAVARGITVNGLPIMADDGAGAEGFGGGPPGGFGSIPDLDIYYEECVIGGPGAFAIAVRDWTEFGPAVRRKMVLEIAGPPARWFAAEAEAPRGEGSYDCLIGEKLWQRSRSWDMP